MKTKLTKSWYLLLVPLFIIACSDYGSGSYGDYSDYTGYGNGARKFGVTVWTNSTTSVNVFVNGQQVGTVSQSYDQAPDCGAPGCVYYDTEEGGCKVTIRGESTDGRIRWAERTLRLNRDCRKVQLIQNPDGSPDILMN